MMAGQVDKYVDEVRGLIEERLRIKARTLEKAMGRAGRLLPKWAHAEARNLLAAAHMLHHPKLSRTVDVAQVEKSHRALVAHLRTIDPTERRKTLVLKVLGAVSFNLLCAAGVLVIYLVWAGHV